MNVRVLYLDDDVAFVRLVEKAMARHGHTLLHAEDLEGALQQLSEQECDAIVLDHYLRQTTGHEVLHRLRESGILLPVVYVTGSNEASIAINALKAGASDYVIKSFNEDFLDLLASSIEQTVENARLRAEKQRAQEEIRREKERAEALLDEVNHRVANSLALVAGLLRLQIANSKSPDVKAELAETQARITAIADMHRSLYTSDDVSRVEMDRYLASLTSQIADTMQGADRQISLTFFSDPIFLSADRAVTVGIVVTELVTNAFKYAYPDGVHGEIRVRLQRTGDNEALLRVEDGGVGMGDSDTPKGTGLGTRIVKSMAATLGTGICYLDTDSGTVAEVPLVICVATEKQK